MTGEFSHSVFSRQEGAGLGISNSPLLVQVSFTSFPTEVTWSGLLQLYVTRSSTATGTVDVVMNWSPTLSSGKVSQEVLISKQVGHVGSGSLAVPSSLGLQGNQEWQMSEIHNPLHTMQFFYLLNDQ